METSFSKLFHCSRTKLTPFWNSTAPLRYEDMELKEMILTRDFQDLNNGVINACFMLLFRDLIRLFACYNDGIINLLEKYFEMQKKQARDALDLYKKFLIRMDRVAEFLKVAEVTFIYCESLHSM